MSPYMFGAREQDINRGFATALNGRKRAKVTTISSNGEPSSIDAGNNLYDLSAVIAHKGKSAEGGHYLSLAYHPTTRSWLEFNDHQVETVQQSYVESQCAYLLFYVRRG